MMNEKGKVMKKVDFVAVEDGMIEFYAGVGNLVVKSADPVVLANEVIAAGGFTNTLMSSSSVDFADEYGFESVDAFYVVFDEVCDLVHAAVSCDAYLVGA